MSKLDKTFYSGDAVTVAKQLLGKYLFTNFENTLTGGIITETEAYNGALDKASHAYGNRRTSRTEVMFMQGGHAYVYLCYGIHSMFNVVTNMQDVPHAVLVRAIYPTHGIEKMLERRNMTEQKSNLTSGPGSLAKALSIHYSVSGINLEDDAIWIEDRGIKITDYKTTPRIGIDYAQEDTSLPYRFVVSHHDLKKTLDKIG